MKLCRTIQNHNLHTLAVILLIMCAALFTNVPSANAEDYISLWDKNSFLSTGKWTIDHDKQSLISAEEYTQFRNIAFQVDHLIDSGILGANI